MPTPGDAGAAIEPPAKSPGAGEPDAVSSSDGTGKRDLGRGEISRPGDRRRPPPPRTAAATRRPTPSPGDDKSIAAMVTRAKAFERDGRWNDARGVYQKLQKTKGYPMGEALYYEAYAAFQAKATDDALRLSERAAHEPGPFKNQAWFLYGDSWFFREEYARAKDIFVNLRKGLTGSERLTAARKIAACNRKLKLPENADVVD
jgi:hypothetical protein